MRNLNRVLFFVSPFHSHGVPLDWAVGAVDKLMAMSRGLNSSGVRVEVLTSEVATRSMLSRQPSAFEYCDKVHALPDASFAALGDGFMEQAAQVFNGQRESGTAVSRARKDWAKEGVEDQFDIVVSFFSETSFLKKIFRSARVLYFETGLVCHLPFQQFHSFDPLGTLSEGSYIGSRSESALRSDEEHLEQYRPILEQIRHGLNAFSAQYYQSLPDLHGLRAKWKRICLLVGQPMGRAVDKALFSSSFEFLEHVLRQTPRECAVLMTEHPGFPQITAAQHTHLQSTYPHYVYSPGLQSIYSPSAVCLPLADAVVGMSSTVLLHAHALGLKTFSFGASCMARLNAEQDFAQFMASVESESPPPECDLQILDLIAHYSVPMSLYRGPWLSSYLKAVLNAELGRLPKIATAKELSTAYDLCSLPNSLSKPADFFQRRWSSSPVSLAQLEEPQSPDPKKLEIRAAKYTVATVLDHYAIGGTQQVIRRLVSLLPEVHWVIFVEKRLKNEFPRAANAEVIEIGSLGDPESTPERSLARSVFEWNKSCELDLFLNPMHWRPAALRAMPLIRDVVGIPVVYWEHNSFFFPMYTGKLELHGLREEVIDKLDRVILLSDYDRWHFATHYPKSRHQVIRNPVPKLDVAQVQSAGKEKTVLVVGRFDPQKRMDRLVPIMKAFLAKHPDWTFTVLGDGYLRASVQDSVAKSGQARQAHFLGHQPDATPYFKKAAIFASFSDYEGDPLTFMEAKANGLPIVSFELFQNTRLRDGVDGFYVKQGDVEGFAEKLSLLAGDSKLRHRMATEGHQHFLSFNNDSIVRDWMQLFEDLIKAAPFTPLPVEAPKPETIQREAVHVAQSVHRLMCERVRQQQARAPAQPREAKSSPTLPRSNPQTSSKKPSRPALRSPQGQREFNVNRSMAEAAQFLMSGRYEEAAKRYEKCVSQKPENANVRRLLAEALLGAGQRQRALEQLKSAQTLKPKNKQLRRRIRKIAHPALFFWAPDRPFTG